MSEWRFFLDENIDPKVATYLDKENVSADHVRDTLGTGADDDEIFLYAREHDWIVVTSDVTDFAPLCPETYPGIILLYDDTMPAYDIATGLLAMVETYPDRDEFSGREIVDTWI